MHPRFKEVIEEKNSLKTRMEEQERTFQQRLKELESRLPAQQPQKDELMERLKSIDPAFAERFGKIGELDKIKQELSDFNQWRQQQAVQQVQQQISSTKEKFYTENSIPSERRELYEAMVRETAQANPKLGISDLPQVMKQVHEKLGKMFQTLERNTTKNFVAGKKAEANKPAPLKPGAPARAVNKEQAPLSRAELRAQMVQDALSDLAAEKDI